MNALSRSVARPAAAVSPGVCLNPEDDPTSPESRVSRRSIRMGWLLGILLAVLAEAQLGRAAESATSEAIACNHCPEELAPTNRAGATAAEACFALPDVRLLN